MDLTLAAAGIAIGLAMAAPLGPVNIIVIRSTLRRGMTGGLAAGAGSLAADTIFAVIAAHGIRSVERLFTTYATPLQILGGVLLVVIGIRTSSTHVAAADLGGESETPSAARLWRKALTTFSATATNPGSLFGVFAIFGSMSLILKLDSAPYRPAMVLAGFVIGGALWWLFLSAVVHHLKSRLSTAVLDRINRWTGVLVAAFGFAVLMQIFG
jgi:threonine/homoserine/homoserine lactone efflux protein